MDDLIARVNVMSADGLRALGSTAVLQVQPMRRLIQLGNRIVDPQSPPLAAFLLALQLFVEAFQFSASGYRLIQIARPSILNYGLYGINGPDDTTLRLADLVIARGNLAVQLDCFLPCQCSQDQVRCQIILDKLLYDIDRAIDALSLGFDSTELDSAETRAFAYGLIIETLLLAPVVDATLQALSVSATDPTLRARAQSVVRVQFTAGRFNGAQSIQNDCLYMPADGPTFNNATLGSSLIRALQALLPASTWVNASVSVNRVNPRGPGPVNNPPLAFDRPSAGFAGHDPKGVVHARRCVRTNGSTCSKL